MSDARQPEVVFFSFLDSGFAHFLGQLVSIIVKTLRNTNLVATRCFKMKKTSIPVDVRRSKTPLLKLPVTLVTSSSPLFPLLLIVPPGYPCYFLLPFLPLVTPCYTLLPLLPLVTGLLPLVFLVTPCYPRYPLLPFVTFVTPCSPLYPLLPLLPLVSLSYPSYPLIPLVTLCYPLFPFVTPCYRYYMTGLGYKKNSGQEVF